MEERGQGWWPEEPGEPEEHKEPEEPGKPESSGRAGGPPDSSGRGEAEARPAPATEPGDAGAGAPPPPRPPGGLESRDRPKVSSRYSLYVGVAFIVIVAIAVINAFNTEGGGILGPATEPGAPLAEFAVPDVRSDVVGAGTDANIADDDCDSDRNPCPDDQIRVPACEVEAAGAIRVCDLFDRPVAISFWFTRGGDCLPTQDAFDRAARRFEGEVNFLSVNVLDDRSSVERIVRERGWDVPVGHDADGAVSNVYRVGVCPTIVLGYPGGILHSAEVKPENFDEAEIEALVDDLIAESRRRERAV